MKSIKLVIAKKEIEFHFGLGFLGELFEKEDTSLEQLIKDIEKNIVKYLPPVMLESAKYAALRKGETLDLSLFDIIDLIDEDGGLHSKATLDFYNAFIKSLTKDVPEEPKEEPKKGEKVKK